MGVDASYSELVAPLVTIGVGIALVLPNVASAALGIALPEHIGKASGTNTTFRQLGARVRDRRRGARVRPRGLLRLARHVVDGVRAALFVAAIVGVLARRGARGSPRAHASRVAVAQPAPARSSVSAPRRARRHPGLDTRRARS